jgi:hypothetical protein
MMESESSLVVSRRVYIENTPRRMAGMTRNLLTIGIDNQENMIRLLEQLQEQAEASRRAGYLGIVNLCQSMENCVLKIGGQIDKPRLETAISTLMEACRVIARHVEIITGMAGPAGTN